MRRQQLLRVQRQVLRSTSVWNYPSSLDSKAGSLPQYSNRRRWEDITPKLLTALADVKSQWDQRTKSEKENIFRDAHSFSGWDIDALQDSTYDSVLVP